MEDEYWKKRYEKLLHLIDNIAVDYSAQQWQEIVENHIEADEIRMEGTVEDAKVRKVTRHDTP